jgi:hypothetical protein
MLVQIVCGDEYFDYLWRDPSYMGRKMQYSHYDPNPNYIWER